MNLRGIRKNPYTRRKSLCYKSLQDEMSSHNMSR